MGRSEPTRVGLFTVGCKLNQYETEGLAELFERIGMTVVPFEEPADVYVLNTCTVTARSDYRSRQMVRRAARRNPGALVAVTGCYVQRDAEALLRMPEVRLVVGNTAKPRIADLVRTMLDEGAAAGPARAILGTEWGRELDPFDIERFRGHTRAFVKIQDGCDRRCSYCAVPDARGPARSRRFEDVIAQARTLVTAGYREIVLTGVHIGAYESDGCSQRLPELLAALASIQGLVRLRLSSIEPTELTPELASAILSSDKVCHHLHVPLESGSDRILSRMRRDYTRAGYAEAVRRVTDRDAFCGLGADVMVGFPGESDEDFAETVALIEALPFTYLHVFAFSPRKNTAASQMGDRVPGPEVKTRSRALRRIGRARSLAFRRRLVGTRIEILVEEGSDRGGGPLSGLAPNYVRIAIPSDESLEGKFVTVIVEGADESRTWGTAVPGSAR
jgi:threonylcarbamoyladenosine tRNA methylthiotransferase MtaB